MKRSEVRFTPDAGLIVEQRIKIEPRKTLNNPDREIDVVIRFPINRRDNVGQVLART